jgi:hypothetical protein
MEDAVKPCLHLPDNTEEMQDEGTTLSDIRMSYPNSYLVESQDHSIVHRAGNYKLQNGVHYHVVVPPRGIIHSVRECKKPHL